MRKNLASWLLFKSTLAVLALGGCSSAPPPRETIAQAEIAIQDAARAGATQYEGKLLTSAQQKYEGAVRSMKDDDNVHARRLAEESLIEARLAGVRAAAAAQVKETAELRKTVDALKSDSVRSQPKSTP
jgi:hypothetical protein